MMIADPKTLIALMHVAITAPFLLFVGMKRTDVPEEIYKVLLVLGTVVLGYHLYRLSNKYRANVSGQWINIIHILFVAPLLIYIGVNRRETPRPAYEMLVLLGFASLGYHFTTLIKGLGE